MWDFEDLSEVDQQTGLVTDYQYFGQDNNCADCMTTGFSPIHALGDINQEGIYEVFNKYVWWGGLPGLVSTNTMMAAGHARGLMADASAEISIDVSVIFDVMPRIDCIYNCPNGGIGPGGATPPGQFVDSSSFEETLGAISDIRASLGEEQNILLVHDVSSTDWNGYAQEHGLAILRAASSSMEGLEPYPLITIIDQSGEP